MTQLILLILLSFGYLNVIARFWTVGKPIHPKVKIAMNIFITIGYLALIIKLWALSGLL